MSKGNVSKIDNLGRVVIPKSIRKALNIEHNDEISMYVDGESLIIKRGYRVTKRFGIWLSTYFVYCY